MLLPAKQFFESLPEKQCSKCGTVMEEQSECNTHVCDECGAKSVYRLTFKPDPKYQPN